MKIPESELNVLKKIIFLAEQNYSLLEYKKYAEEFLGYPNLCESGLFCCTRGINT